MQSAKYTACKLVSVAILFGTLFVAGAPGQGFGSRRPLRSNLTINPNVVTLGSLNVGVIGNPVTVTLSNPSESSITITSVNISLAQVLYSGPALPATIAAGQSIQVSLTFIPSAVQSYTGTITFLESNGRTVSARVTGAGVAAPASSSSVSTPAAAQLTLSSASLAFGSATLGAATSQTITVSNTGGSNLTILGVTLAGAGFNASGLSSGLILAPGQSAVLTVTFDPAATGSASGSVTISTDVAGSSTISLSGSGAQAAANSVLLSWVPSTSSSVAGYNVYRATSSGAESGTSPINGASPVAGSTYTDTAIVAGTTYYYEVVAVSSANVDSPDSNEASLVAP